MYDILPPYVSTLGDPHLARKFVTGVAPEKKGIRETLVREHFKAHVNLLPDTAVQTSLHICMGDLFDKFRVPEEDILFAAKTYIEAAEKNENTVYVILRGNHDASRDTALKSSFDVFRELVRGVGNILVVDEKAEALKTHQETFVFYPWHPFKTAAEIASEIKPEPGFFAFGHWDILSFNEDSSATDNLIPFEQLAGCKAVVNGHYHLPRTYMEGSTPVIVTGSMQPYSHAEDPTGNFYVTHTLSQVQANLAASEAYYEYKNLRVLLEPDEAPIADVNCLSLTFKTNRNRKEEDLEVNLDTFDLEAIFKDRMKANDVSDATTADLWNRLLEQNAAAEA